MKVKVCGMRDSGNIFRVAELGIDYMGFIFHAPSPRNCREEISREVLESLPADVEPVAVTVNLREEGLIEIAESYGFRTFQLHGSESPALCSALREKGMRVIKAFGIASEEDIRKAEEYSGMVDFFLFDTATATHGGSGIKFDWKILENYNLPVSFLLSGGIGPEDWESVGRFHHPRFTGIDLNSRFELSPGVKDPALIGNFLKKIL